MQRSPLHDGRSQPGSRRTARSKTGRSNRDASSSPSIPRCSVARTRTSTFSIAAQLTLTAQRAARHAAADARAAVPPAIRRAAAERRTDRAFESQGDSGGAQTYDLLREGVDYYIDPSQLWFALVRPLIETNERLVVAYNVRLQRPRHGVDDDRRHARHRNSSARDRRSRISSGSRTSARRRPRSAARFAPSIASPAMISFETRRTSVSSRAAGSSSIRSPASDATFLQMLGLAQSTNPAEFDYNNRIWPRARRRGFNLGIGATDVRSGQIGRCRASDSRPVPRFPVAASVRRAREPRAAGSWCRAIRRTTIDLHDSGRIPLSRRNIRRPIYRIRTAVRDGDRRRAGLAHARRDADAARLGARRGRQAGRSCAISTTRIDYDLGRIEFMRPDTLFREERRVDVRYEENPGFAPALTTFAGFVSELPVSHGVLNFTAINQRRARASTRPQLGFQSSSTLTDRRERAVQLGRSRAFATRRPPAVRKHECRHRTSRSRARSRAVIRSSARATPARRSSTTFDGSGGTAFRSPTWRGTTAACRRTGHSLRVVRRVAVRAESRRDARLADERADRRVVAVADHVQAEQHRSAHGAHRHRVRAERAGALVYAAAARARAVDSIDDTRQYDWTIDGAPDRAALPFDSHRAASCRPRPVATASSSSSGRCSTRRTVARGKNRTLIFDFGDVSENSLALCARDADRRAQQRTAPSTACSPGRGCRDSTRSNTERDAFSRSFNAEVNDTGLPGDVVDTLVVIDGATVRREMNAHVCRGALGGARGARRSARQLHVRQQPGSTRKTSTSTTR